MGEHLVQSGLAGSDPREAGAAGVEAQANVAVGAVEPVGPAGIDLGGFERSGGRWQWYRGRPNSRLELLGSVADLGGRLLGRDGALEIVKLLGRARAPVDADSGQGVLELRLPGGDVLGRPADDIASLRADDAIAQGKASAQEGCQVGGIGAGAVLDVGSADVFGAPQEVEASSTSANSGKSSTVRVVSSRPVSAPLLLL